MRANGKEVEPLEPRPAAAVEMWYDRHEKRWVLYPADSDGNQLAEAEYAYTRADAIKTKRELAALWDISRFPAPRSFRANDKI